MTDFDPREWLILPNGSGVLWSDLARSCGGNNHGGWHLVKYDPTLPSNHGVQCLKCLPPRPQRRTRQGLTLAADVVVGRVDVRRRCIVRET
jgi:hypothetical protein